jgi:hypothetical protein
MSRVRWHLLATIAPEENDVKFFVKASVAIDGKFNKWEATLTFPSTDVTSGILDIKIYADSVNTGSGVKDDKLKSKIAPSARLRIAGPMMRFWTQFRLV